MNGYQTTVTIDEKMSAIIQTEDIIQAKVGPSYVNVIEQLAEIGNEFAYMRVRKTDGDTGLIVCRTTEFVAEEANLDNGEFALMLDPSNKDLVIVARIDGEFYRGALALTLVT